MVTRTSSRWTGISLQCWHFSHTHKFQESAIRQQWYAVSRPPFTVSCNSKVRFNTNVINRITFFLNLVYQKFTARVWKQNNVTKQLLTRSSEAFYLFMFSFAKIILCGDTNIYLLTACVFCVGVTSFALCSCTFAFKRIWRSNTWWK